MNGAIGGGNGGFGFRHDDAVMFRERETIGE